jgi:hypothetical protein
LLIKSNDPHGLAYVETSTLDGYIMHHHHVIPSRERNLKQKETVSSFSKSGHTDEALLLKAVTGTITCDKPNSDIHSFSGVCLVGSVKADLSYQNLLLRVMKGLTERM